VDGLDVATPERVALDLPLAGIGTRALAYLVDAAALFAAWVVAYFALSLLVSDVLGFFQAFSGVARAVLVAGVFFAQWVYWTACEVMFGGKTLGKRALRIRVARLDGSPPGVLESAVRNLCRAVDFLPALYFLGLMTALVGGRSQRLGDLLAGTVLVRDGKVALPRYELPAAEAAGPPLSPRQADLVRAFLQRAPTFDPDARRRLGRQILDRFGARLPEADRAALAAAVAEPPNG
jgi:uncharacterized RDD family membrane protein YckC